MTSFLSRARRTVRWQTQVGAAVLALVATSVGLSSAARAQTKPAPTPSAATAQSKPVAVTITNQSEAVLCAEKDNVALGFQSSQATRFQIEAAHPAYLNAMRADSFEADWTDCSFEADPVFASTTTVTRRTTLFETPDLWVVGWTFPTFWRPSKTPFLIGDKQFDDLHLVQIWMLRPMGGEEVLVVYPQDGYWRIRPKAPAGRDLTAFGSSVLIGPVTDAGRPVVELKSLRFEPGSLTFSLDFASGETATVKMSEVTDQRHVLDVAFSKPIAAHPFAMLRSMYVTDFNNDAAGVAMKGPDARGWVEAPVLTFGGGQASDLWLGRTQVSRHNTSSPDHVLRRFAAD